MRLAAAHNTTPPLTAHLCCLADLKTSRPSRACVPGNHTACAAPPAEQLGTQHDINTQAAAPNSAYTIVYV